MSAGKGPGLAGLASARAIAMAGACVLVIGFVGILKEAQLRLGADGADFETWAKIVLNAVLRSFKFFSLDAAESPEKTNWWITVARTLGGVVTALALVKVIAAAFRNEFSAFRARFCRGHAVLLGLGARNSLFALDIARTRKGAVAAVDLAAPNAKAIGAGLRGLGLEADLTVPSRSAVANVRGADLIVVGTGSDERNMALAGAIVAEPGETKRRIVVTLDDPGLAERCERMPEIARPGSGDEVFVFGVAREAARAFLNRRPMVDLALGFGQTRVRLVIVGASDVAIECALGFLRCSPCAGLDRPLVQIVAADAEHARDRLIDRSPVLAPLLMARSAEAARTAPLGWAIDIQVQGQRGGAGNPSLDALETLDAAADAAPVTAVVVAVGETAENISAALALRDRVDGRPGWAAPIFVHSPVRSSLDRLLIRYRPGPAPTPAIAAIAATDDPARAVEPFGRLEDICRLDAILGPREAAARRLHEAYLAKRAADAQGRPDDRARMPWETLDETFRRANRRAVDRLVVKRVAAAALTGRDPMAAGETGLPEDPGHLERLAAMEHDSWRIDRELDGWTRAPERDDARRRHPNIKTYDELTEAVKDYDRDQIRTLIAMDRTTATQPAPATT